MNANGPRLEGTLDEGATRRPTAPASAGTADSAEGGAGPAAGASSICPNLQAVCFCFRFSRAMAVFAGFAACFGLMHPHVGLRIGEMLGDGMVLMHPATAVTAFLAGMAILCRLEPGDRPGERWRRRGAVVLSLAAAALALAGAGLGLTSWMSAIDIVLIGAATAYWKPTRGSILFTQGVAHLAGLSALVALIAYLYDLTAVDAEILSQFLPILSAGTIGALSLALLFARPQAGITSVFVADTAGGRLLRSLAAPLLVVPPVINGIELAVHQIAWLPHGLLWVLDAAWIVVLLELLVWRTALKLHEKDRVRMRSEEEAARLREQLGFLVSTAPVMLYRREPKPDFRCTYISDNIARTLGYTPREFVANGRLWLENIHPEDAPAVLAAARAPGEGTQAIEYRFRRKDGEYRWMRDEFRVVHDSGNPVTCLVGCWYDITEQRGVQHALRESEELYHTTFDAVPFGVAHVAMDGRYLRVNARLAGILDHPVAKFHELRFTDLLNPDDAVECAREFQRLLAGDVASCRREFRFSKRDGAVVWADVTASLLRDAAGAPRFYVVAVEDLSRRLALEAQLRQIQKLDAVGHLAGGIAHDFNNVLTAISGNAALLDIQGGLPKASREAVAEIDKAVQRAARLTRQLLIFSRREVMQRTNLDLNQAVTQLGKMLQRMIGEGIPLELRVHGRPLPIHADPGMIDQILMNLAVNARDAMNGNGRLLIETAEDVIDQAAAQANPNAIPGHYARVAVRDTGTGIAPDILPRIFEPFFTTKEVGRGAGLGLATVFGIVNQHRGWVHVATEVGRGSTFSIYLPLAGGLDAPAGVRREEPVARNGEGRTVLLVEDNESVRSVTVRTLETAGYRVLMAANGPAALQVWERNADRIDVVLSDIVMPEGMSGRELADRLQSKRPSLGVVLVSGFHNENLGELPPGRRRVFLAKPYEAPDLLTALHRMLTTNVAHP